MRLGSRTLLIVASVAVLGGCGKTVKMVELTPALTAAVWRNDHGHSEALYCAGELWVLGTPEGLFEGSPPEVGYSRGYKPGSGPLPCWEWSSSVGRGLARFDVSALGNAGTALLSATLDYDATYEWSSATVATNEIEDIIASIHVVNAPWGPFQMATEKIIDTPMWAAIKPGQTRHFSRPIDVGIVRGWLTGERPNHGILFVGRDESLPERQSATHMATLTNLKLRVQIAEPQP